MSAVLYVGESVLLGPRSFHSVFSGHNIRHLFVSQFPCEESTGQILRSVGVPLPWRRAPGGPAPSFCCLASWNPFVEPYVALMMVESGVAQCQLGHHRWG
jgi:hypothetical protein